MRVAARIISIVMKLMLLAMLWIVYLPINILDFLWVRLVEPKDENQGQEIITY